VTAAAPASMPIARQLSLGPVSFIAPPGGSVQGNGG
jgi:hypothetical protein